MKASVINNLKKAGLCLFGMGIAAINASGATAAELQAEIDLLQVRSKVNFLSLCVVICVMMIFFMWGMKEHHRKHVMMLERKNRALQRAHKEAADSRDYAELQSQMKTIYTKNLAHEIRTPLGQVYGFTQVMADDNIPMEEDERKEVLTKDFNIWQSDRVKKWISQEEIRALMVPQGIRQWRQGLTNWTAFPTWSLCSS